MKKLFLIPLMTLVCSVMAWANVAQITFSDEREAVDCADLAALQTAIAALPTDGTVATIQLLDDINGGTVSSGSVLQFLKDQVVILDLNGKNITANLNAQSSRIIFNDGGKLTIDDTSDGTAGKIENTATARHNCWRTIYSRTKTGDPLADVLHLKRCRIIAGSGCAVVVWGKELIIEDGVEIEAKQAINPGSGVNNSPAIEIAANDCNTTVTINGGTFTSKGQAAICLTNSGRSHNVTINGGTFIGHNDVGAINGYAPSAGLTISGGRFSSDPYAYLDQAVYRTYENEGYYLVQNMSENASVNVYTFAELKEALNSASDVEGKNITIQSDIVINEPVKLKHGSALTIPANKTLSVVDNGLFINEGVTTNNGVISVVGSGFFSKPAKVRGNGSFEGYTISQDGSNIYYEINNAMQLQWLSYLCKIYNGVWYINLTTDITIPEGVYFEPIYFVTSIFSGNNHKVSGIKIRSNFERAGIFEYFRGEMYDVTFSVDVTTITGTVGGIAGNAQPNTVFQNVTVEGSVYASGQSYGYAGFAGSPTLSNAAYYLWFVNCTNKATVYGPNGAIAGGFLGTSTGAKGTAGFYNCKNEGNISSGLYAGALAGYGPFNNGKFDVIAFTQTGTISGPSNSATYWKVNGSSWIGIDNKANSTTYIDPETYIAVYDESQSKFIAKEAGTLDNTNSSTTDWATSTTWTEDDNTTEAVPNAADNVTVSSTVVVNDGTDAEANKVKVAENQTLTIKDGGTLTIGEGGLQIAAGATVTVEEGATLVVGKDGITGDGELIVKATQAGGTGVVLVDPTATEAKARPEAKIELIPDAHFVSGELYKYRYIGIPLYFEGSEEFVKATNWEVSDPSATIYFKQWNNGAWEELTAWNQLVPFKGYATSNSTTSNLKYTFKGKLIGNGDGQMNFSYGFNLFANSYAAPINIQTLLNGLSDDVKATIYMFKEDKLQTVSKADFAGFRTPKFTVIPSLQAFFVLMDDGTSASETVNYADAVFNNSLANTALYAPQRQETPDFNRVRINIADENGENDEVYLIEAADYTNDFENGFDEVKYMNNGLNLFATTAYGRQSTEITNDLNGTFIGVQGNGTYTLTFDELVGEEYQIRDLQTNAVVAMSEANTYTFTTNGTNDARFVVESIAKMPTALDNVSDAKMFVNNNTLYISENNSNANVMIYAANGQLVLSAIAQPTISLNGLANGVYTVRVANQTLKFVK